MGKITRFARVGVGFKNRFLAIACLLLLVPMNLLIGQNYQIPDYKTAEDYANIVYIDFSAPDGGDGTIESPYNGFEDFDPVYNTAYLFKAGTVSSVSCSEAWNHNYVGKYGKGDFPRFRRMNLRNGSQYVTFDSIEFRSAGSDHTGSIIRLEDNTVQQDSIVFANCKIIGTDEGNGYPGYGIRGGSSGMVFFHCEIGYTYSDNFLGQGSLQGGSIFVSNYFHHANLGSVVNPATPGDALQIENGYGDGLYFANNWLDRSTTIWKFALIINSTMDNSSNAVCEWNTLVSPVPSEKGGATIRWLAGSNNKFNKNLVYTPAGISCIASYQAFVTQPEPYGVRDNHWVGGGTPYNVTLDESNLNFADETAYQAYLTANSIEKYGSDIDTANFWGPAPYNPCNSNPIAVSGTVGNDTNDRGTGYIDLNVSGGNGNLFYDWSNGKTTQDISGLSADSYIVTVSDDSACSRKRTFTVYSVDTSSISSTIPPGFILPINTIETDFEDGSNVVENMLDKDLGTRWSSNMDPAVAIITLDNEYIINHLRMAFYLGDQRNTFFKIYTSNDQVTWTSVLDAQSSGNTTDFELFELDSTSARYIMIEGYGNNMPTAEDWTSITEIEFWGDSIVTVVDSNSVPVVAVNFSKNVSSGTIGVIDASNSFDPDGDEITYNWNIPDGINVRSLNTSQLEFLAPSVVTSETMNVSLEVSDGETTEVKDIDLNIVPFKTGVRKSKVISVSASSYQDPNYPENVIDNNPDTRWSAEGNNEWIILELDNEYQISHIEVTFSNRESSVAYFELYGSKDNKTWEVIEDAYTSCGFSNQLQAYGIPETKASETYRYVELVGKGSSENEWNSYASIDVYVYENTVRASGLNDNNSDIFEVYPNPASSFINLSPANITSGTYDLSFIDITGKVVSENSFYYESGDGNIPIDISNLINGIYMLKISSRDNNITVTKKILVQ